MHALTMHANAGEQLYTTLLFINVYLVKVYLFHITFGVHHYYYIVVPLLQRILTHKT